MAECNNYTGLQINPTPSSIGNQYAGVSTDEKPANAPTYSVYLELDTGKFYYYDGTEWKEVPCCGDSGGDGGGGIATAKVTFSNAATDGSSYTVFTTFQEEGVRVWLEPVTIEFPLYNGVYVLASEQLFGNFDESFSPEITGSITLSGWGLSITGDGGITVKSKANGSGTA